MADIGDVADTLVGLISATLYPNGVSAGAPLGVNFRIYRGHPGPDVLDQDMQAGGQGAVVLAKALHHKGCLQQQQDCSLWGGGHRVLGTDEENNVSSSHHTS